MDLPSGTVTFLFSDIEGSTQLLQALGDRYAQMLDDHQRLLRAAWTAHGGSEVNTQGDSFFVAFPTALAAVTAAIQVTRALAEHAWPDGATVRARVGLHTGAPRLVGVSYIGLDVHRAARIAGAGHGGQVLLSRTTRDLVEHELTDGMSLRDLGTYRLKDLPHPEHLYQLVLPGLPAEFAPLKTLETRPHNLPVQPTPLIGREEAVATLAALLRGNGPRLVTLTGPGGIGKTRLSIQVAAELMDAFADGVWFMRLSRLSDPALVLPTIAQTLGLKETSGQPLTETLRAYLRGKDLLLLLDNFEQVVAAATDVAGMLEAGPRLKVLVTSRIPLRLRGEKAYRVAPLSLAASQATQSPMRLAQYSAVALFIQRAQEATADFALTAANAPAIAEICARLDGLPLAIELAAARVRLLPPEALLGRLSSQLKLLSGGARDLEARQRTMRATIGWSEDLLTADERTLFRRLAVFAGGWTLEAAEAVCMAPAGVAPLGSEVLECLATLVDHGLARQQVEEGEARFGMLHIIREYALERLEISGEAAALCQAHLASVLALAERAARHYRGPREAHWLAALEREHDNVRAALGWTRAQGLTTAGLRLAGVMARFW
ncbi:MAG TPA: adenylate/guanylate cyclase domain-containing protein, partial [Ktedonobacterales bacterium]